MAASRETNADRLREMEQKLQKLMRERSVYAAKARLLAQELEHYRGRELRQDGTVEQLLERQHEMAVMLNRSNMMLARAQDAAAALSLEFGELARALPAPDQVSSEEFKEQVEDKVQKINDLFKRTGQLSEEIADTLKDARVVGDIGSIEPPRPAAQAAPPPPPQQAVAPAPIVTPPPTPEPVVLHVQVEPEPVEVTAHPDDVIEPIMAEAEVPQPEPEVHFEAEVVQEHIDPPDPEPEPVAEQEAATEQETESAPEEEPVRGVTVDLLFGRPRLRPGQETGEQGTDEGDADVSLVIEELANAQEQADAARPGHPADEQRSGWRRFLRKG